MSFAVSNEEVQALFDKELDGLDCYTGYIWDAVKNGGCLRNDLEWTKR